MFAPKKTGFAHPCSLLLISESFWLETKLKKHVLTTSKTNQKRGLLYTCYHLYCSFESLSKSLLDHVGLLLGGVE